MIQKRFEGLGTLAAVTLAIGMLALGGCGKKPLPPLSAIVDAPYIRPGSSWTYKVEDSAWNAPQMVTLTFMKDDVYKNAGVLAFAAGNETHPVRPRPELRGGRLRRADPPRGLAVAPVVRLPVPRGQGVALGVHLPGQPEGALVDPGRGVLAGQGVRRDQLSRPAKFRAFLLESEPSTNWGIRKEQVWYSPQAKQLVKRLRERTAAHYEGKGKDTWELVQYTLK